MEEAQRNRRDRDLTVLLPVFGALLFLPPIVRLFTGPVTLFGIPLIVLYIFSVWALLILLCLRLARRLHLADPGERR
ncbi:MAG: hypothetical protein D6754_07440 [Alphaproteobacteria bacterium]|nr:MAG: hypothetical protein D6754_07440 [Alphaproteobacteria bacterium]